MKRVVLGIALLVCLLVAQGYAVARPYSMLYVFGDSYSDSGAGYVDSDGPTAVVYMAQRLGIPFTWFGAPDSKGKGLNFAVSGARTGSGEGIRYEHGELLSRGMENQVADFVALVKQGTIHFDPAQRRCFTLQAGLMIAVCPMGRPSLTSMKRSRRCTNWGRGDVVEAELVSAVRSTVRGAALWKLQFKAKKMDFRNDVEMGTSSTSADQFAEMRVRRLLLNEHLPQLDNSDGDNLAFLNNLTRENLIQGLNPTIAVKESLFSRPVPSAWQLTTGIS